MNRGATVFLRVVLVLIGLGVLAFLVFEPQAEGRNAHATLVEIYFKDPFLAFLYVSSIPFFIAIFQGIRLLGYAGKGQVFSPVAVKALRTIKWCATAMIAAVAVAEIIILMQNTSDDRAGGVMIGLAIAFVSLVVAAGSGVLERNLQRAVDLQSENDLTV